MISFIVPAHNEQALLGRTLAAIAEAAKATDEPYEVVVVDDASDDATAEIARGCGARVEAVNFRQIAATRNAGARASSGEYLFFVDADTFVTPGLVAAALEAMRNGAAGGGAPAKMEGPMPLYARLLILWFHIFMRVAELSGGAFLFCRREAFEAVGGFDERLYGAEDAALSAALKRVGRFKLLWTPVPTSGRRVRTSSGLKILTTMTRVAFFPRRMLQRRSNVAALWYDSDRKQDEQTPRTVVVRASNAVALVLMILVMTGPLWNLPLPAAYSMGVLGTVKYGVQVFQCHVGLLLFPCAYFLVRCLAVQPRWGERVKLLLLLGICLWGGWSSARELYWIWRGWFETLV